MGLSKEEFRSYYLIFGTDILETRTPGLETTILPGEYEPRVHYWLLFLIKF